MSGTAFKDTWRSSISFGTAHKLFSMRVQLSEAIPLSEHFSSEQKTANNCCIAQQHPNCFNPGL